MITSLVFLSQCFFLPHHCQPSSTCIEAKYKSWFQAVIALYQLSLNWSLEGLILGKAVELSTGSDGGVNVNLMREDDDEPRLSNLNGPLSFSHSSC